MIQEDRELLLKDLCARLPYKIRVAVVDIDGEILKKPVFLLRGGWYEEYHNGEYMFITSYYGTAHKAEEIRPYLRPMSSMTEEEKLELLRTVVGEDSIKFFQVLPDGSIDNTDAAHQDLYNFTMHWINFDRINTASYLDWLNKNMFDYRCLIPKGLALEAPEGMYKKEE